MRQMVLTAAIAAAAIGAAGSAAKATVLDFNTLTGLGLGSVIGNSSPGYGDNVNALSDTWGTYQEGNGFTPDVTVDYRNVFAGNPPTDGLSVWGGSTAGSVIGPQSPITEAYLTLTAAAGFNVTLNSFDVGVFGPQTTTFSILDGGPDGTVLMAIDFTSDATLQELVGLTASQLTIAWGNWNTGLAKVNFDESAVEVSAVPLPAGFGLLATSLAGLGVIGRRGRRKVTTA